MARKRPLPKIRPDASSTVSPAALNAMTPPAVTRSLADILSAITGSVLLDLLMAQGKTIEEAAILTGIPQNRLKVDGLAFAVSFVTKLDPLFGAVFRTDEENRQFEEDVAAQLAASGPEAPYVAGAH